MNNLPLGIAIGMSMRSGGGGSAPEPKKCPHCNKELPPEKEDDPSLAVLLVGAVLLIQLIAGMFGATTGSFRSPCKPMFSKKYHFVVPAYPAACHTVKWLREDVQ